MDMTECLFSHGRILLSHTCNHLSVQSVRTLLSLGSWSLAGHFKGADIQMLESLGDIEGDDDVVLPEGWDFISTA